MKDLSKVLRRPLITERGADLREASNQYLFEVAPEANKLEIKRAVEQLFGKKVVAVVCGRNIDLETFKRIIA